VFSKDKKLINDMELGRGIVFGKILVRFEQILQSLEIFDMTVFKFNKSLRKRTLNLSDFAGISGDIFSGSVGKTIESRYLGFNDQGWIGFWCHKNFNRFWLGAIHKERLAAFI
jgi:hypothetical protein